MATVAKDFKVKNGLIVEGTNGTINNYDILTKKQDDQDYIIDLIGGQATPNATANAIVLRDENADFAANMITADLTGDVTGTVSDISNHDTDDLVEGTTNKYYADSLARGAFSGGTGLDYDSLTGEFSVTANTYDAYGAAGTAESNANSYTDTHSDYTTGVHGVSGDVVGTSDTQTLTNKTIGDELMFNDGANTSSIDVTGNDLSITADHDLTLTTNSGQIILNPDDKAYIGSASAGNEIATNSYVDNAVSGLNWKQAVHLLYNDPTPTLSGDSVSSPLIIDGHAALGAANVGYRILVSSGNDAGIYVYNQTGTSWTISRTEDADVYSELIGAAVFVMEGDQYNNTSWVQSNHYITDFTNQSWTQFSGSGSITAGTGIIVDGLEVSVDTAVIAERTWVEGLTSDEFSEGSSNLYYTDQRVDDYVNNHMDTDDVSEGSTNKYYTDQRVDDYINNSMDTDDLSEGATNKYFTENRAKDAAGYILENATLQNIQIIYDENAHTLAITAENGVADSTTADLDEDPAGTATSGTWYFTNQRAQDALQDTTPRFTAIDIGYYTKQIGGWIDVPTASTVTALTYAHGSWGSAEVMVRIKDGSHSQVSKLLVTRDAIGNLAVTEYGIVTSNGSLGDVTADVNGSDVRIRVTTAHNNSEIMTYATLLAYQD